MWKLEKDKNPTTLGPANAPAAYDVNVIRPIVPDVKPMIAPRNPLQLPEGFHKDIFHKVFPLGAANPNDLIEPFSKYEGIVTSWTQDDWVAITKAQKTNRPTTEGKKRRKKNDDKLAQKQQYMQDKNGNTIFGRVLDGIRKELTTLFCRLNVLEPCMIMESWVEIDRLDEEYAGIVYSHLRQRCPEFRLCEDNWKARTFMVDWYKGWWYNRDPATKSNKRIKIEQNIDASVSEHKEGVTPRLAYPFPPDPL